MKRLILSALVLGAATQAAGCIITSDDDPTGSASVNWQPLTVDFNSGATLNANCPSGGDTAVVFSQPVGAPAGDAYLDKFDCADISGNAQQLPVGEYEIYVEITNSAETQLFAQSGSTFVDIVEGGVATVNAAMYIDQGFYQLDWQLSAAGSSATCADVDGENGVSIVATVSGGTNFVDTVLDCEEGLGVATLTDPMPLTEAGYTVVASLLNQDDISIGDSEEIVGPGLEIGNTALDIGTATIVLR